MAWGAFIYSSHCPIFSIKVVDKICLSTSERMWKGHTQKVVAIACNLRPAIFLESDTIVEAFFPRCYAAEVNSELCCW